MKILLQNIKISITRYHEKGNFDWEQKNLNYHADENVEPEKNMISNIKLENNFHPAKHVLKKKCLSSTTWSHITVKPVLSGHLKRRPKIGFQDWLLLNAGQKYCILQ